jgi:hypothetical protein
VISAICEEAKEKDASTREEITHLPWRGQCGRAASGCARAPAALRCY